MSTETAVWQGVSGKKYSYEYYSLGTSFKEEPGNYIFARIAGGKWQAVYIGEAGNLRGRFADRYKEECIQKYGATHIHAHLSSHNVAVRRAEEKDLTDKYTPPCNG